MGCRVGIKAIIPTAIIAAIMTGDIFSGGILAPATAPALAASCVRLAPVIGQAAIALGASEAYQAAYTGVRAIFNKVGGSGGSETGGRGPAQKKTERQSVSKEGPDGFSGRKGFELQQPKYQQRQNKAETIDGRLYSGTHLTK